MGCPRFLSVLLVAALVSSCENDAPVESRDHTNIVLILADDLGYGDLGAYGATLVNTPNVDRLADEGMIFRDAHSSASVCTVSRYSILTGRYSWRPPAVPSTIGPDSPRVISPETLTVPAFLRDNGYTTGCIGKWHLGIGDACAVDWTAPLEGGPNDAGFDYYFGIPWTPTTGEMPLVENERLIGTVRMENSGRLMTDRAVRFVEENRNRPFFLYLSTLSVHIPLEPDPMFQGSSAIGPYGDMIHEFDWTVGRILDALERTGNAENTLVIVTSDNGPWMYFSQVGGHDANGPFTGGKFSIAEGGHRVPFIVRWPGFVEPGTVSDGFLVLTDLFATFASVIGAPVPVFAAQDSIDVLDLFLGSSISTRTHGVFHSLQRKFALRAGSISYIPEQNPRRLFTDCGGDTSREIFIDGETTPEQLYDLTTDLATQNNLVNEAPELAASLHLELMGLVEEAARSPEIVAE